MDGNGYLVGHVYDRHGVAIIVQYTVSIYANWSNEMTMDEVTRLVRPNGLPSSPSYSTQLPRTSSSNTIWFRSADAKDYVGLNYGDVDKLQRLYRVFIETTQGHEVINN